RLSPACNLTGQGIYYPQTIPGVGLSSDAAGNLYGADFYSIWRTPSLPPPPTDTPSPSFSWAYNAASNLSLSSQDCYKVPPGGKVCYNTAVLDSIAPNEIVRITGGCMGPLEPQQAEDGKLPSSITGTRVLFDGVPAPLLSVQSTEILAVVPQKSSISGKI